MQEKSTRNETTDPALVMNARMRERLARRREAERETTASYPPGCQRIHPSCARMAKPCAECLPVETTDGWSDWDAEHFGFRCEPNIGLTIKDDLPAASQGSRWLCWEEVLRLHSWLKAKIDSGK